jgi:hypothetical protein
VNPTELDPWALDGLRSNYESLMDEQMQEEEEQEQEGKERLRQTHDMVDCCEKRQNYRTRS